MASFTIDKRRKIMNKTAKKKLVTETVEFFEDKLSKVALSNKDLQQMEEKLDWVVAQIETEKKYFKRLGI